MKWNATHKVGIILSLALLSLWSTEVLVSHVVADGAVETVITFDQGARWQTLRRPKNSHCDTETSTNRPNRVGNTYFYCDMYCMCFYHNIIQNVWFVLHQTCTYYLHQLNCCVFTVPTSHPWLLQHRHEDERPHAASVPAQRCGPHPGSWYHAQTHTEVFWCTHFTGVLLTPCLSLTPGSEGDAESAVLPDVYVSEDGGYSWLLALRGPHHYAILDSGGLLVAVEHTNLPVNQIKWGWLTMLDGFFIIVLVEMCFNRALMTLSFLLFIVCTPLRFSTDEGQCWHTYNFTSDPIHFSGLDSEPGSRSMTVSLWGYRNDFSKWVVITIDFKKLLARDCEYVEEDLTWFIYLLPINLSMCMCRHRRGLCRVAGSLCRAHWI